MNPLSMLSWLGTRTIFFCKSLILYVPRLCLRHDAARARVLESL